MEERNPRQDKFLLFLFDMCFQTSCKRHLIVATPQTPKAINIGIKILFTGVPSKFFSILPVLASTGYLFLYFKSLLSYISVLFSVD